MTRVVMTQTAQEIKLSAVKRARGRAGRSANAVLVLAVAVALLVIALAVLFSPVKAEGGAGVMGSKGFDKAIKDEGAGEFAPQPSEDTGIDGVGEQGNEASVVEELPPMALETAREADEERVALISHYQPWVGGTNCARFVNGQCVSATASGRPWQEGINKWLACPREFPFGTAFQLPGGETFYCYDRGGKIVTNSDGSIWLDLLIDTPPPVPYGTRMTVKVFYP